MEAGIKPSGFGSRFHVKDETSFRFTTSGPGRKTLITSLDKLVEGLNGQTGTWIVP